MSGPSKGEEEEAADGTGTEMEVTVADDCAATFSDDDVFPDKEGEGAELSMVLLVFEALRSFLLCCAACALFRFRS